MEGTENAIETVLKAAAKTPNSPFEKADPKDLKMTAGCVHEQNKPPESGVPVQQILTAAKLVGLDGHAKTDGTPEQKNDSTHSFGAHFCEVSFDPEIVRLRVTHWVSVIDRRSHDESEERPQSDYRLRRHGPRHGNAGRGRVRPLNRPSHQQ